MNTEEIKKEADEVYNKYFDIWITSDMTINLHDFIKIVIQDRNSVLEATKKIKFELIDPIRNSDSYIKINNKIQSLTEQIEYLKSKL